MTDYEPERQDEHQDARVAVEAFKARLRKILFEDAALSHEHRMQRAMDALEPGGELDG